MVITTRRTIVISILLVFLIDKSVASSLHFCMRGNEHELSTSLNSVETSPEAALTCPGGIVFNRPLLLKALTSDSDQFCVKTSVCDETWQCGFRKQNITAQVLKIGKVPSKSESWHPFTNDKKLNYAVPECHLSNHLPLPFQKRFKRDAATNADSHSVHGLVPAERTSKEHLQLEVDDQTKRLFYYLSGINKDQVNSHLRIVKLFKMSTQLVPMICDPLFLPPRFLQEIEKAFLFLLKEQGFDNLVDIDLESYNALKQSLEHCAMNVTMVKFMGQACPTQTKVESVYRHTEFGIRDLPYERNEKTFKWGEYDVVIDAAWQIVDLVHGGCFDSFANNLNLHHKFQVALEQLFHAALYLRWEHPTRLGDELFYDSVFLANVNSTMEVMDACGRFLYLFTPFGVQLNRPIHETIYRRKKRSIDEEGDLMGRSFSSQENLVIPRESVKEGVSRERIEEMNFERVVSAGSCLQSGEEFEEKISTMRELYCT